MLNHNYTASLIGMEDAIVTNLKKDSRTRISREENPESRYSPGKSTLDFLCSTPTFDIEP